MAITLTKHAEIRAVQRSASVDLGHALFRKAMRALANGKAKQYEAEAGRTKIVWNGWQFIAKADWWDTSTGKRPVHTLITMFPTKDFRPA